MHIGQMVYYRVSREDADAVNRRRAHAYANLSEHQRLSNGTQIHFGTEIEEGQLLPAIVIRAYNAEEKGFARGHDYVSGTDRKFSFSGVADIRVLLPGNDILFVPGAIEDTSPQANYSMGMGITTLPAHGLFTQATPAELLG